MEANIEEPMSLDELAASIGVSRRQIERLFKRHLDQVPTKYYLELRLRRARELLLQTSMSIMDITTACGFQSPPHFSKCYRNTFGYPPSAERQTSRARALSAAGPPQGANRSPSGGSAAAPAASVGAASYVAVDGEQQFVHAGEQGDLGQLAAGDAGAGSGHAAMGCCVRRSRVGIHRAARKLGVADGGEGAAYRLPFARLFEGGDGADIGGERAAAAEVGGVADVGDDASRGLGADAVDGGEQAADLVLAQFAVEVAIEIAQAAAQGVEVIAGVTDLQAIGSAVMLSDRAACGVDECARQVQADVMAAVVAQRRPDGAPTRRGRRRRWGSRAGWRWPVRCRGCARSG